MEAVWSVFDIVINICDALNHHLVIFVVYLNNTGCDRSLDELVCCAINAQHPILFIVYVDLFAKSVSNGCFPLPVLIYFN